jgi:DNA-binding CsgD family transcriptional regulator
MMTDINLLDFQHHALALLILLACVREDYAEGVRLKEQGKRHSSNTMGRQLFSWALATLACGLDQPAEARHYLQEELQLGDPAGNGGAATVWIAPSAVYALADTNPATAVELLSWVFHYPDTALERARRGPLLGRVRARLAQTLPDDAYRLHWEQGQTLTLDAVQARIGQQFGTAPDALVPMEPQQLLTARESDILRLLAAGLTNPQIAEQLVIGAGTVKTHTLSIYRKLDVANRTQAITRAQELGLLRP